MRNEQAYLLETTMEQMINPSPTAPVGDVVLNRAVTAFDRGDLATARTESREAQADAASREVAITLEAAVEALAGHLAAASERLAALEGAVPTAYQIEALGALGLVEEACALEADLSIGLCEAALAEQLGRVGRGEEGLRRAEEALAAAQTIGDHTVVIRAAIARSAIALRAEDCEAAQHAASEGLALAEANGHTLSAARLHGILGEAALGRGEKTALAHFEAMKTLADAAGARALQAQARFGLAAAGPQTGAAALVVEAQRLVRELVVDLAPEAAARVLALPELARILAGNHMAFGRARRRRSPTGPVGFTPRMMGW